MASTPWARHGWSLQAAFWIGYEVDWYCSYTAQVMHERILHVYCTCIQTKPLLLGDEAPQAGRPYLHLILCFSLIDLKHIAYLTVPRRFPTLGIRLLTLYPSTVQVFGAMGWLSWFGGLVRWSEIWTCGVAWWVMVRCACRSDLWSTYCSRCCFVSCFLAV
jgi:hypothetical protein